MNSVAEKILADAESTVKQMQADLLQKEQEVTAEHEAEKKRMQEAYDKRLSEMLEAEKERAIARVEMELKKELLKMKIDMVADVVVRCVRAIEDDAELYRQFLVTMAVKGSLTGKEEVILSDNDKQAYGDDFINELNRALEEKTGLKGDLTMSDESRPIRSGLVLKQGDVEFNGSVETAVRTIAERHRVEIAQILFPKED